MKNKTTYTLGKLLEKYKVEIPAIQRDYAFGRENENKKRENFIKSIKKALLDNDKKAPLHLDFIYGKEENKKLFLLDGQQRITTLWLVAVYLNNIAKIYNPNFEESKLRNLDKFSYDTRTSSRDFCKAILSENLFELDKKGELNSIDFNEQWFFNKKWVFNEWKYDPTIMGMFNVLKEIHKELYDDLINDNYFNVNELMAKIDFSFLNIEELGNPEELYLKMNSRGKPLSEWDDFKAELFKFVDKDESIDNDFKYLVDTELVDLFWEINKKFENLDKKTEKNIDDNGYEDSPTDKGILKLFKSAVKVEIIIKDNDKNNEKIPKYDDKKHYNDEKVNKFVEEHWADIIDLNSIQKFWKFLNKNKNKIEQINDFSRFDNPGIRINDLFKSLQGSDSENMTSKELSLFAAYYLFVKNRVSEDFTYNEDDLKQTIRVISNYQGKNYRGDFSYTVENIENIKDIFKTKEKTVLEYLKDLEDEEDSGSLQSLADKEEMPSQKVQRKCEEKLKAKMLISDDKEEWEKIIYKCEKNPFSKGSAKWLLEISKEDGEPNLDNANKYYKMLFDEKYVEKESKEEKHLFNPKGDMIVEKEAALLSYVDIRENPYNGYFPKGIISNTKYYSWWSIFKNANYNIYLVNGLREFLDSGMNIDTSLDYEWKQWYIEEPILFNTFKTYREDYSGPDKYVIIEDQKTARSNKYSLQLEALREYYKDHYNNIEIKTTKSPDKDKELYGFIGNNEIDYEYKITYENKQFVIYHKNEKGEDKKIPTKGVSVSDKLKKVSEKLYSLTQNNY